MNGKSLQVLLSLLDDIKKREKRVSARKYKLEFYLKEYGDEQGDSADSTQQRTKVSLKRVSFSLELEQEHQGTRKGRHLVEQLTPLFELCGLTEKDAELSLGGFLSKKKKKKNKEVGVRMDTHKEAWEKKEDWDSWDEIPTYSHRRRDARDSDEADDGEEEDDFAYEEEEEKFFTIDEIRRFLAESALIAKQRQEEQRKVDRNVGMNRMILMTVHRGLKVTFGRKEITDSQLQLELTTRLLEVITTLAKKGKELANCTICFAEMDGSQPGTLCTLSKTSNRPYRTWHV